jgi:hypothetical protein
VECTKDSKCSCLVDLHVNAAAIQVEEEERKKERKEEYLQPKKPEPNGMQDGSKY